MKLTILVLILSIAAVAALPARTPFGINAARMRYVEVADDTDYTNQQQVYGWTGMNDINNLNQLNQLNSMNNIWSQQAPQVQPERFVEQPMEQMPSITEIDAELVKAQEYRTFLQQMVNKVRAGQQPSQLLGNIGVREGQQVPTISDLTTELSNIESYITSLQQLRQRVISSPQTQRGTVPFGVSPRANLNNRFQQPITSIQPQITRVRPMMNVNGDVDADYINSNTFETAQGPRGRGWGGGWGGWGGGYGGRWGGYGGFPGGYGGWGGYGGYPGGYGGYGGWGGYGGKWGGKWGGYGKY